MDPDGSMKSMELRFNSLQKVWGHSSDSQQENGRHIERELDPYIDEWMGGWPGDGQVIYLGNLAYCLMTGLK